MITRAIPQDTKSSLMISFVSDTGSQFNLGAPSTPYYIYNYPYDLTNINTLFILSAGKKNSDLGANNTIKLIIDSTTELTLTYSDGNMKYEKNWVDVSAYSGKHTIKLYVEGGSDEQIVYHLVMVGLNS